MKKFQKLLFISYLFSIISICGCSFLKSEDDKIKEALIGKVYQDDTVDDDGNKIKNINGEFYSDGKFWQEATIEIVDDETFETTDIKFKIKGDWDVREKYLYYTYDFNTLKITPEFYMLMKEEMIENVKNKNTPEKIIDYGPSKIVYEDSDGERQTMKKSY